MKRPHVGLLALAGCLCLTGSAAAQLGSSLFSKPNIADIFKPVVGSGAAYEQHSKDEKRPASQMEMTIVGKEMTANGEAYWMEIGHVGKEGAGMIYSKVLVTKDFQFTKVVFQEPGKPAMEMPFGSEAGKSHLKDEMAKWHQVGSETITVPAGTFGCMHWKNEDASDEVWTSDKVTPMAMVKQVGKSGSMVLTKIITGATDHITGPVTKFDPEELRKQYQKPQ